MIIKPIQSFILTHKIKKHHIHKSVILNYIDKLSKKEMVGISNTDWDRCADKNRDYVNYFVRKVLIDYNKNFNDFMFQKELVVQSVWFQQYYKGDYHNWHIHDRTQFTNIYFLELPEKKLKTQIFDVCSKKMIDVDVEEGDLLTFPSYIIHRSKINTTDKRKTIISFNTVFGEIDVEKIERTLTF